MKVTIIGSGAAIVSKERRGSSFLVDIEEQRLLFDCGWGCALGLVERGVPLESIDHIFISHPHVDHLGNLLTILQSIFVNGMYFPEHRRSKPLHLHGYPGFKHDYEILRTMMFPERNEPYAIVLHEYLNDLVVHFDHFSLQAFPAKHSQHFSALHYSIEAQGKKLFYSGDTGNHPQLVDFATSADIAVFECSVSPVTFEEKGPNPNHLSPYEVGLIAEQANIKQLVITHLYPFYDEHVYRSEINKQYTGKLISAYDGLTLEIL